jgi:hypothetical protein
MTDGEHSQWEHDPEPSQTNGPEPPSPPTLAQAIAAIVESRDEQTELL